MLKIDSYPEGNAPSPLGLSASQRFQRRAIVALGIGEKWFYAQELTAFCKNTLQVHDLKGLSGMDMRSFITQFLEINPAFNAGGLLVYVVRLHLTMQSRGWVGFTNCPPVNMTIEDSGIREFSKKGIYKNWLSEGQNV